jgi:hypothetical protein
MPQGCALSGFEPWAWRSVQLCHRIESGWPWHTQPYCHVLLAEHYAAQRSIVHRDRVKADEQMDALRRRVREAQGIT